MGACACSSCVHTASTFWGLRSMYASSACLERRAITSLCMEDKPQMIRRCLCVFVLLMVLAMPVFSGIVKPSGAYCEAVDCVTCFDASCDGGLYGATVAPGGDVMSGLLVLALTLFMVYRLKV